ncbi:MAG: MoaD/ThiS family protein [Chloroflexota bacterium]
MPSLHVPSLMKFYLDGQTDIEIDGATIAVALNDLILRFPAIKFHLFDKKGEIRRHINLFINENNIKELDGINTPINKDDRITIVPSISGG